MTIDLTPAKPARTVAARMVRCIYRQKTRTHACPELPRLDGRTALVTGGIAGVGEFVSRGLLSRGAGVVSLSRGVSQGTGTDIGVESLTCDLADPDSVVSAVDALGGRRFDLVICNSGIVMREHQTTALALEKTFAVNVFGHHLLYRLLLDRCMLGEGARIVLTTGEAYVMATECAPRPKVFKPNHAYASSKLGNLWQVQELVKRWPKYRAYAVHPGAVLSGLGGGAGSGFAHWLTGRVAISEEQGAQAALIAATQALQNGAYWHNVAGVVDLVSTDAARDHEKSARLWAELERLAASWL